MKGTRKNLTEGTRIAATVWQGLHSRTTTGTVHYLERDYDGRSKRWSVVFTDDATGKVEMAWLADVTKLRMGR